MGHNPKFWTCVLAPSPHHLQVYITKMAAAGYCKITINLYQTTRRHNPEYIRILTNSRYKISDFTRAHEMTIQHTLDAPRYAIRPTRSSVIYHGRTPIIYKIKFCLREKDQCIRQKTGVQNIVKEIKQYQKKWLQHVQRMDTNRLPKQALQYKPKG